MCTGPIGHPFKSVHQSDLYIFFSTPPTGHLNYILHVPSTDWLYFPLGRPVYRIHWPSLQHSPPVWFVQYPLAISSAPSLGLICTIDTDHIFNCITQVICSIYLYSSTLSLRLICAIPTGYLFNCVTHWDLNNAHRHLLNCISQFNLLEYSLQPHPLVWFVQYQSPAIFSLWPHSAMYSTRTSTGHVKFIPPFFMHNSTQLYSSVGVVP